MEPQLNVMQSNSSLTTRRVTTTSSTYHTMAEHGSPALNTQIESGKFDEKERPVEHNPAPPKVEDDEDEDEDIDALIEDLESQDGHGDEEEEEERDQHGARLIPEELLQTVSLGRFSCRAHPHANHTRPRRTPALVLPRLRSSPAARSMVSTR